MTEVRLDASRHIVTAVDATERSLDPLALGRVLGETTGALIEVVSVFPYFSLADLSGEELTRLREEARAILRELAEASGLPAVQVQVIPGNAAAAELQRLSEQDITGAVVVGSTHRGPVGRVLPGAVGERLLTGSACPVAIAPRGYADRPAARLERVGVAFDGSDEARGALAVGRALALASGAELRLMSVFQSVAFGVVATGRTGGASVNALLRAELRNAFDEALADLSDLPAIDGRFLEGITGELLADETPSSTLS
jgi:nucleotide-binding universal stress UspA family protein